MSDLVGNPEDRFSRVAARIVMGMEVNLTECDVLPHFINSKQCFVKDLIELEFFIQ